jgi:hypothetical protein
MADILHWNFQGDAVDSFPNSIEIIPPVSFNGLEHASAIPVQDQSEKNRLNAFESV